MDLSRFEKMTNRELVTYCNDHGIDYKSGAKNVSKPTKTELLHAISDSVKDGIKYDLDEAISKSANDPVIDEKDDFMSMVNSDIANRPKKSAAKMTKEQKRRKQYAELMPLRRVIITSNNTNQTMIPNQIHYCTWGNRILGYNTDRFILGKPWHVREGALRNLMEMRIRIPIQNEEGETMKFQTVPAYNIQRLDDLSEDEIKRIARKQIIRDSSIESLL